MNKINVAGLKIDTTSKKKLLEEITIRIKAGQKTFVTTPYSEFLFYALKDAKIMDMLNQATFAVPDGIGIFWAARYVSIPLTARNYWLKILQAFWQAFYSLLAIIFYPKWIKTINPDLSNSSKGEGSGKREKIVGADLIWDLAKLANENYWSVYLLGGFGDTPELVAKKLQATNYKLKIAGYSNKNPDDSTVIDDIKKTKPDVLMIAYGPIKQESWITKNFQNLPCKLVIGLGGTFDYLAKKKANPPKFLRFMGFEWLWRLFTQPRRFKRIYNATFGLVLATIKHKFYLSFPYRRNVVNVIINQQRLIFVGQCNPQDPSFRNLGDTNPKKLKNYWEIPQGGIKTNEELIIAAERETFEETGIKSLTYLKTSFRYNHYIWNTTIRPLFVGPRYRFKGQEQKIVYFKFNGNDQEIKLDKNEFIDYKWVPIKELDKIVHQDKNALVKIIQEDLKNGLLNGII